MSKKAYQRYLSHDIAQTLEKKMVFIGGPRQVGKTTLCLSYLSPPSIKNSAYLNWDDVTKKKLIKNALLPSSDLIVFDEVHKYKYWRNLIKGIYDTQHEDKKFLVTGSARLDHYRKGGDSLLGRYRYFRLHPLSVGELHLQNTSDLKNLLRYGGFPESYFTQSEKETRLWQKERLYRIINDDIADLENLKEYSSIENLAEALPDRIGSLLSYNSLAEDLSVNPRTIEKWIQILENVYYCFLILPFGTPKVRALKKAKKLYLWDWSTLENDGPKFENLVGSHLLKYCHYIEDTEGYKMELRYLRDTDNREIDFVVLKNKKPIFAVECKTGDKSLSPAIRYFKERTSIPKFYQVHMKDSDFTPEANVRVLPFIKFCNELKLP
ncbi:MAG: ATP-binding protein [Pseudobdellovibrio sp.]